MTTEEIIPELLRLGFKDESTFDSTKFTLGINNFELEFINGKFSLEADGGYDYNGTLDLDHLHVNQIKLLYIILTGENIEEKEVFFNYSEWKEKLKKSKEDLIERQRLFLLDHPHFANLPQALPGLDFLDFLSKQSLDNSTTIVWHEQQHIKEDPK
jgi:hypothetical protein